MGTFSGEELVARAFELLVHEFRTAVRLMWLPILISWAAFGALVLLPSSVEVAPGPSTWIVAGFVLLLYSVGSVAWIIAGAPIHRFILRGDRHLGRRFALSLRTEEWKFLLAVLAGSLPGIAVLALAYMGLALFSRVIRVALQVELPMWGFVVFEGVAVAIALHIFTRLLLVAPAAIAHGKVRWKESWRLTQGKAVPIFGAIVATSILPLVVGFVALLSLGLIHGFSHAKLGLLVVSLIVTLVGWCWAVLLAGVAGNAYLILRANDAEPGLSAPQPAG